VIAAVLVTLVASIVLCRLYLQLALRWQLVATPDARSSHRVPTPHGGGAPMLLAFSLGLLVAAAVSGAWAPGYMTLAGLALLLMLLGIADDLRGLSVSLRFGAYGLSCLAAAWYLLPQPPAGGVMQVVPVVVVALAMLWLVNLYNFMDGIDGIAAIQCVLACSAAAFLSWRGEGARDYSLFCLLLAASQLGFLVWNWPPARLFMGDAGSVPTGFLLAGLALAGSVSGQLGLACWLILLAAFITDASWTLCWRLVTGQSVTSPHRLHAYQRLSRHWGSHLRVDMALAALFAGWLLPLAWLAQIYPKYSILLVILAYLPLLLGMAKARPVA
jgi:Fuc2NAc and GlcNAc transferase